MTGLLDPLARVVEALWFERHFNTLEISDRLDRPEWEIERILFAILDARFARSGVVLAGKSRSVPQTAARTRRATES